MENATIASAAADLPADHLAVRFRDDLRFWIQRVAVPIVVCVGVLGNAVTVVVLTRRRMSSSTNTYLTALAVADLLYLLGILYLSIEHYPDAHHIAYLRYWQCYRFVIWFTDVAKLTFLSWGGRVSNYVVAVCNQAPKKYHIIRTPSAATQKGAVSVWLTVSFTVERYIAVCHPLRGKVICTENRARRVILMIFVLCTLATATTPFEYYVRFATNQMTNQTANLTTNQMTNLTTNQTTISIDHTELADNNTYRAFFYWFWAFAFVFVPLVLLAVFNTILVGTVRRSIRQRGLTEVETNCRQKQENKITMTLIAVVFLFMVCQTPQAFLLIVTYFYSPSRKTLGQFVLRGLGNIANFLVAINAASNFILYCAMSDKYKRTLMLTFFPCLSSRHRRSHTFNSNVASYENSSIRIVSRHS